jgi:hypothetical protein
MGEAEGERGEGCESFMGREQVIRQQGGGGSM